MSKNVELYNLYKQKKIIQIIIINWKYMCLVILIFCKNLCKFIEFIILSKTLCKKTNNNVIYLLKFKI